MTTCNPCPTGTTMTSNSCIAKCTNGALNSPACNSCPTGQSLDKNKKCTVPPTNTCSANKIKVAGNCVCDPTVVNSVCKNTDNQKCPIKEYRLGNTCVKLEVVDQINDAFWNLYNRGFWI